MLHPVDGSANKSTRRRVTFGVSKLWVPHVILVCFIYYVLFSPEQHVGQDTLWTLGTNVRTLVGGRIVNASVAFMWIAHVFEAGYAAILARRYGTTLGVGVRRPFHSTWKRD